MEEGAEPVDVGAVAEPGEPAGRHTADTGIGGGEAGPGPAVRIRRGMGDWRVRLGAVAVALLACVSCHPATPAAARTFTVLQMNLCDSGQAGCYAGGAAIPEAAGVIRDTRPDGPVRRIMVASPWDTEFDKLAAGSLSTEDVRSGQLLGELVEAGLAVRLGDRHHVLPVRLNRWPTPHPDRR